MSDRQVLFRRAADCYLRAGLRDDACRCLEEAGEFAAAGREYEALRRPEQAAGAYQRGRLWREAARCLLAAGRPLDAARAFESAGELLAAAWVLADTVGRYDHARAVAVGVATATPAESIERALVMARCEAGNGNRRHAAELLATAMGEFARLAPGVDYERLFDRALTIGGHLERADLAIALFALARKAGALCDLERRWEAWAVAQWGAAHGVPGALAAEQSPQPV